MKQDNSSAYKPVKDSAVFGKSPVKGSGEVKRAGDKSDVKNASKESGK